MDKERDKIIRKLADVLNDLWNRPHNGRVCSGGLASLKEKKLKQ